MLIISLIYIVNIRSTIEHVNGRLKKEGALFQPWRHHDPKKHELVFELSCQFVNHSLSYQPVQKTPKSILNCH